ncbi:hypothetical protein D918_01793 [Trichuris suis]|uniref:MSP domain-containing protein n=1 Tax=Trichuris suis TaxID=68888 RepID=A0A085MCQ5_9BILA|nr:hypothetical protein M513_04183 [Trichuris suis]KHJ47637.1 hypothetical protein D918_01793 [Trichuris suis]
MQLPLVSVESEQQVSRERMSTTTATVATSLHPPIEAAKITLSPRRLLLVASTASDVAEYVTIINHHDFAVAFKLHSAQNDALYSVPSSGWILGRGCCVIKLCLRPLKGKVFRYRSDRAIFVFARFLHHIERLDQPSRALMPFCQKTLQVCYSKPINQKMRRRQLSVQNEMESSNWLRLDDKAAPLQANGNGDDCEGPTTSANACNLAEQRPINVNIGDDRLAKKRRLVVGHECQCLADQRPIVDKKTSYDQSESS